MCHWLIGIPSALVLIAATLKALHVIGTRALRPIYRAARETFWMGRVVTGMAEQFRNNGGSTLRDVVDGLVKRLDEQDKILIAQNKALAELGARLDGQDEVLNGQNKVLDEILEAVTK